MQALAILVTLALAIIGGCIAGLVASRGIFKEPAHLFDDVENWDEVGELIHEIEGKTEGEGKEIEEKQ